MRALVLRAFGVEPRVEEVPDPEPPPDGVVLRVTASGLCRSDWHAYAGHDGDVDPPQVLGHELAGVVERVGPEVTRWRPGDRVTTPFVCGCGRCATCRGGDPQVCPHQRQPGFTDDGSLAERVALHHADANLVALPAVEDGGPTDVAAAALGCRTATAYRALGGRARLRPGESVVVLGCGGVGLSAVVLARAMGAGTVVAIDVSPAALARARELGADVVVDASAAAGPGVDGGDRSSRGGLGGDGPVAAAVRDATGGGAAVAVEALGSEATLAQGLWSLRRRGRLVQVGLLPPGPDGAGRPRVALDRAISHELDLLGSHGMAAADYPGLLALVASGALDPGALVGEVLPLAHAGRALVELPRRTAAGVVVVEPWR
ncbi:alcohol dehydrogenase catalytic domain-containing protein [uncultured Pseudokineococcus sp.]|uniref:alcohol dehydrogenase catalytic domain-containing protein n=1 Tax=uncultured Pseudokineococcus sp. TaxID=1642928 RepID=UPI00262EE9AE|nr:alcohol dehydrogenase catalytic domain-containing protein [uncultured Pseudokineococcus sp.]